MTGPVVEGRSGAASQPGRAPLRWFEATVPAVSTRGLILAALLCGLAILIAFTIQITIAS